MLPVFGVSIDDKACGWRHLVRDRLCPFRRVRPVGSASPQCLLTSRCTGSDLTCHRQSPGESAQCGVAAHACSPGKVTWNPGSLLHGKALFLGL
jgi:hypothetical protein